MESAIGRKGFDEGVTLGDAASHEIRALVCHPRGDDLVVASGDKRGAVRVGVFSRANGSPVQPVPWRVLPWFPAMDDTHRVIDALTAVVADGQEWLAVGTRGNGAWLVSLDEALDASRTFRPLPLPGSEDRVVRRLRYDAPSRVLWAAVNNQPDEPVETRLVAWRIDGSAAQPLGDKPLVDIDTGARVTALAVDAGPSVGDDQLYVATNLCTLHRLSRSANLDFEVTPGAFDSAKAVWRGRSSVIESIIPLSAIARYDDERKEWVRRFRDRGIVATTLRHIMVMSDLEGRGILCDVRRVAVFSKILAAAPISLAKWAGIAVATLDGKIRLFRPSGIRRPAGDFVPYSETAPENAEPRSLIGGYEDLEMRERAYAIATMRPQIERGDELATVLLGMGDNSVRFDRFEVGWDVRERAMELAREIAAKLPPRSLLQYLESNLLHSDAPSRDKYAASVLLPEIGVLCRDPDDWRRLKLLVWDILAGTDSKSLQKVPVHVVQSLRRLQMLYPDKQDEIEQTIMAIRKHIFDKQSFSGKSHNFLSLTNSTDPDLADDRVVYQSILLYRRHDPVFQRRFTGEVRSFAAVRTSEPDAGADGAWRFLVGTYRGTLSIFDAGGNSCEVAFSHDLWGHVQSMLVTPRWVVFGFSKGTIRRVPREVLDRPLAETRELPFEEVMQAENDQAARSLATLPGAGDGDERFLYGDATGTIRLAPTGQEIAKVIQDDLAYGNAAISVLRSFVANVGGADRRFFVAGTDLGKIHLYEWPDGGAAVPLGEAVVGAGAVATMLVQRVGLTQVIAGCTDGNVTGLWVVEDESGNPSLSVYWAYRADDAVHDIQLLPVNVGTGDKNDRLIGIASHDKHIHVLDHVGRHLETVFLNNVKLDRFAAVPDVNSGEAVECRIFACAFENEFLSFRLVSRRKMLEQLGRFVDGLRPAERERRLTRWRAFAIHEDHLRRRFVRQSRRYPGPDARAALREIHRLMDIGNTDPSATGVVAALLRRLFQNEIPGEMEQPRNDIGLREILGSPDMLYADVVKLLRELEEQWDTPGSDANRRVQYFWIRSLLRNIDTLPMLRKWLEKSEEACAEVRLADPRELLYHFLEHPNEIVQFKVLQCVERLLFGWPGVGRPGVVASSEGVERSDLAWLLSALLARLRNDSATDLVVLQIGKMLCELIRTGCVEALQLAYDMLEMKIPAAMFTTLAGQCSAMSRPGARASVHDRTRDLDARQQRARNKKEDERLQRAAELFRSIHRIDALLRGHSATSDIIEPVEGVLRYCAQTKPWSPFLAAATRFYNAVPKLLSVVLLRDITHFPAALLPKGNAAESPSSAHLAAFRHVVEKLNVYWTKKYEDLEVYKLDALTFEAFDDARSAWRALRDRVRGNGHERPVPVLEHLLLMRICEVWEEIVSYEQNEELLRDLVQAVQEEVLASDSEHVNAAVAVTKLQEAEEFTARALKNFLIRLVLFSEPARAALFHRSGETKVAAYVYDAKLGQRPAIAEVTIENWPPWLDRLWSEPARVAELPVESVEAFLKTASTGLQWQPPIGIPDIGEANSRFGYFVFGWSDQAAGARRFESAKLLWNLLLQSLVFRKASLKSNVMTSRVFSMVAHNLGSPIAQVRSNAELLLGKMLDSEGAKEEKYSQILRQGRHMHGIIDAILSMDGREAPPDIREISIAALTHDVVRTVRSETLKSVIIDFPEPTKQLIEDTLFFTDEIRVYDILLNLLGNAVKYSPKNGKVWVTVSVKSHGAELRVRDEGPGIAEDEKERIFKPFIRGRSSTSRKKIPGLGLGLYVVDLYTRSLRGRVQIQNESERGTSFIVYLPVGLHPASHPHGKEHSVNAYRAD
jgi:signal transduction histidine kinase